MLLPVWPWRCWRFWVLAAATASADGGPHVATGSDATPDKCAGCHRIHTGQNEYLLKEAGTVPEFCYSCHGTGGPGSDLAVQEGTFYGSRSCRYPALTATSRRRLPWG